jgi:hypothetical protein
MRYSSLIVFCVFIHFSALAQVDSFRNFYLGHSLINTQIPQMVHELAKAANHKTSYKANIGNGANLGWHWTHPLTGQGESWTTALVNNTFDHFILTEAVPLKGHLQWSRTYDYLDSLYLYAAKKSPKIKMYMYETWHCTDSGTPLKCEWDNDSHIPWRDRLDRDTALWQGIVNEFVDRNPNADIFMVPGGQALALLHDIIDSGNLPGVTSHRQLFSDNIHLTSVGNYFIACVMYSTIYHRSPEGLPYILKNMYGQNYTPAPTMAQAQVLQKAAWQAVCDYKHYSGVNCSFSSSYDTATNELLISTINDQSLVLKGIQNADNFSILNTNGKIIQSGYLLSDQQEIKIGDLPSGVYFLRIGINTLKFIRI